MTAPCETATHAVDNILVGNNTFSGLYIENFLSPDEYVASLGYYRKTDVAGGVSTDLLIHQQALGTLNASLEVNTEKDTRGLIHIVSDLDPIDDGDNFNIDIKWQKDDDTFGACDEVDVRRAAFLLENEQGIAMEIDFAAAVFCRDTLRLKGLSRSAGPYTLIVTGLATESNLLGWYGSCESITSTAALQGDDGIAVNCDIPRYNIEQM
jgi:hypothetical protein